MPRLPHDEESDHREIGYVEQRSGNEGRGVKAEMIVERAGEPAAERHPRHSGEQQRRHPPRRLGRREQLAYRHDIGRDDAAEAEPVGGRDREQPGLVLGTANAAIATAWHAEPASTAPSPPIRSAAHPQNMRLTKAQPSSTDSIAAPCAAGIPRSLQNATRCPAGIAIGTQHKNAAAQISACTRFAGRPKCPRAARARRDDGGSSARPAAAAAERTGQRYDRRGDHHGITQHRRLPAELRHRRARKRSATACRRYIARTRSTRPRCRAAGQTSG